ncbi:PEP-CTERM-box response regulator transcription factor [Sulfurimicrobium lacus]|uniref:PEP-CTERM-box response regulator transcription factor n=1 Tax=Sulfurimicrobium lacus TaxID=2715678 RepID=A0A6F8V777_9PROT|nr:sigma-54 dependent transcriptional regulator [Sulfurimicrobium lacus]BCB25548.1 PEP-CTERM-box response regulator transcription factor [Sulfurimicrobium lacus]
MQQTKPSLLIVDDDPLITDTLHFVLGKSFEVYVADSREQAASLLRQLDQPPQLALVDLGLPPLPHRPDEGFKLIGELLARAPEIKIVVLSGQNDDANARHARTLGAVEFIAKPCEPQRIESLLLNALRMRDAEQESATETTRACDILGNSFNVEKLRQQISQFADAPFPVLIEGESGSGKELVAGCLHRLSARVRKPFLALNCAAISPTLVEPTLFGYSKGAFTGAVTARSGYFEDASDGTLFLDEIGELPVELQAKLLRVLENGEFQRVGETQTRHSNARIIAATNRDLRQEIKAGNFRADLYHRLSVFTISVPPLRDMGEDKALLLGHFRDFYMRQSRAEPFVLTPAAQQMWQVYPFPGNVRELRNIVIRLVTKYAGQAVTREQLQAELDTEADALPELVMPNDARAMQELAKKHLQLHANFSLDQTLKLWEQSYVEAALKLTHGNLSQAAKLLGVNRTTLYSRMQTYSNLESYQ